MNSDQLPLDLFNASPNPYVVVDPNLVIADANLAYIRVTGSHRDDILGRYIFDAFPSAPTAAGAENVRLVRESMLRAFKSKQPDVLALIRFDMPVPLPDGRICYEERYWSATHTPIFDERGEPRFVLQHTVDISELHRLRQQEQRRQEHGGMAAMEGDVLRRAEQVQAANMQLESDLQHLTSLFDLAPGFMAVLRGPDHVFQLANAAYLKLIGRTNVVGKNVREALPEVEGQGFFELLDEVYNSGRAVVQRAAPVDLREPASTGFRRVYVDFVYQPMHAADGLVSGIFVEGHDVTQQVTAREVQDKLIEELEAAKERLSRSLSTGRVGVFDWEVASDILSISGPIAEHFGVTRDSAERGLPLSDFVQGVHDEDRERVAAAVRRTVERKEPYEEEYRLRGLGGDIRYVIARGHIEEGTPGKPRFIGVLIDVTEQKQAELAVREAGQRLRLALEASRMGDWKWEPVVDRVELSERGAEILGASSCTTSWKELEEVIHPEDHKMVMGTIKRSTGHGSSHAIEYRVLQGPSGAERWVALRGRGNYDERGRLTGMFGIVEDITARKRAEEAQTVLLREVDHRAKNVLAVVRSLVRMTPFRSHGEYIDVLSGRIHALARAHSLLSNNRWLGASLADLVRQELAPYSADDDPFDLHGPPVEIRPQGTQPLSLILHELATNAAKHGALSHPGGRIHVRWAVDGNTGVELEWSEAGRGVSRPDGAGFGSRLISGAAEQMQACVRREWLPQGLRFTLVIPGDIARSGAGASESPLRPSRQGEALAPDLQVLITEDEALIAMEIEEALVRAGAQVVKTASSLEVALASVEADDPDIVVVDMDLGGKSALPLVELLRKKRKPFVIATGFEQLDLRHNWILRKPISHERLVGAINQAVERFSAPE